MSPTSPVQSTGLPSQRLPSAAKIASAIVGAYLRYAPVHRGKWWLRRKASPWLVTRLKAGAWIRVSGVSGFEWDALIGGNSKESATAAVFKHRLSEGMVVLDIGANIGYYSLTAARIVGPAGRVICYEPGPSAAARLRENIALNRLSSLTVIEAAVSDKPGTLQFHLGEDSEAGSLYNCSDAVGCVDVPVTTIDEQVRGLNLAGVDLIKIDAEGAEVRVLRGAQGLLFGPRAPSLIVEANPITLKASGESMESLRRELLQAGYLIEVIESAPWEGETVENWLATKP